MTALTWAALILGVGLALAILEVFVPSGGVIGFLSALLVVAGVCLAFWEGLAYGLSYLAVAMLGLPLVMGVALHYWPRTPMGKRLLLNVRSEGEVMPDNEVRRSLKDLVGQTGQAKSHMLPSGSVWVAGQTVDALSEGMAISAGEMVRVVEVRGMRVVVRPLTPDERGPPPESTRAPDDGSAGPLFDDPFA